MHPPPISVNPGPHRSSGRFSSLSASAKFSGAPGAGCGANCGRGGWGRVIALLWRTQRLPDCTNPGRQRMVRIVAPPVSGRMALGLRRFLVTVLMHKLRDRFQYSSGPHGLPSTATGSCSSGSLVPPGRTPAEFPPVG